MSFFQKPFRKRTIVLLTVVGLVAIYGIYRLVKNWRSGDLVTINAYYMQYACGDSYDDMKVSKVSLAKYKSYIDRDIDPEPNTGNYDLAQYFYDNRTNKYGMEYRLKGYFSRFPSFGCDGRAPKFWVVSIERMDGKKRVQIR
jgi:hypothetical protein